jgi:alpha-glucosidase
MVLCWAHATEARMSLQRRVRFATVGLALTAAAACQTSPPPPALPSKPAGSVPLSTTAARPTATSIPWWRDAVFYEIYPRSFQDSDGDGIGDLKGIASRLDYLADLGIDAIWITPFFPSPQVDFGYDISDYENIDPQFGTLADFDRLVVEAHRRHVRVLADLVLNHTSDKHPWFVASRSSRENPYRPFYVWHDPVKGGPPNNWSSIFEPGAWTFDPPTGQYFYHAFYAAQPDLNWRNPDVERAMFKSVRFWLDRGVDGFRLDAITELYEDPELRDNPLLPTFRSGSTTEHDQDRRYNSKLPECHELLQRLRGVLDPYPGDRMLVSELYVPRAEDLVPYYGPTNNEVQLPFNFLLIQLPKLDATAFRAQVDATELALGGRPTNYVLSNHDQRRSYEHFGDGVHNDAIARLLALMLFTLRGAPFVYYGEELGMVTTEPVRLDQVRDPVGQRYWPGNKGRDGERTPMQWDESPHAGFTTGKPWLPIPMSASTRNAAVEAHDPTSLLSLYKRLIQLRRASSALHDGTYRSVGADPQVFAYVRKSDQELLVALNMSGEKHSVPLAPLASSQSAPRIVLSTRGARPAEVTGGQVLLAPFEGVLVDLAAR